MAIKIWNVEEFRILTAGRIPQFEAEKLEAYVEAIDWNLQKIGYHSEMSKKPLVDLHKRGVIREERKVIALQETVAEIEAMIQVIHSCGDKIAQIVNLAFSMSFQIPERNVSLNRSDNVIDALNNVLIARNVQDTLINLRDSHQYLYVNGFCNTIKHRTLIRFEHSTHASFTKDKGGSIREIFRFERFEYEGSVYSETDIEEVRKYVEEVKDFIIDVGNALNDFFKNNP